MSDTDETATEVESQAADTQEDTAAEVSTQQEADETQTDEAETSEETDEAETDSQDTDTADGGEDTQTEEPQKTKEDFIKERIARREAKRSALQQANQEFKQNMDNDDWEQRVQAIENDRFVEKVETNISNARRDIADAKNLPVFKEDPELLTDIMRDAVDTYGVFHNELKEENGDPVFLGFYDPKTGQPISLLNVVQREAARLERVAERSKTAARVKAADDDAKVRARADVPNSGGKNTVDATGDENLTAAQYAKKYNLGRVRM